MIYCFFVSPKSIIKLPEKHITSFLKIIFTYFIIIVFVFKNISHKMKPHVIIIFNM